ncbi:MAG TPA: ABC transporter substrate-binding protein [Halanaerobiales bacterium]|nr:ABC transporter substrate-binding protein [Halanaerobiales bacterium]
MLRRTKKRAVNIVLFLIIVIITAVVGKEGIILASNNDGVIIQTPPTVAALPLLWMKEEGKLGEGFELEINISPDHNRAVNLISRGDIDLMVTGVNVGARAFNREIDVRMINTNIWAIDYLLTKGFQPENWDELKGKTLSLPLKGGPLDFLVRYLMRENGVDPEQVEIVYMPLANGAGSFQLGKLDAIVLPEPQVTIVLSKTDDAYLAMDLQQEWACFHDGDQRIPFVGLFAAGGFIEDNPELAEKIKGLYREGVDWVQEHPEEAAILASDYFDIPAGVIKGSFKRINLNYYSEAVSRSLIEIYFREILEMYPDMIGGQLPDEEFYF